jgi:flagellar capping protein FliD
MGFRERMEEIINQGVSSSRELLDKAKEKAKDLGERGIIKYELMQLEKQAEKQLARLGGQVYEKLVSKKQATVSREAMKDLLTDISDLKQRIEEKEEILAREEEESGG